MNGPFPLTDGRVCVPGNHWDLLDGRAGRLASVAVVIPFFEQQDDLNRVLAGLDAQDYPAHLIEVAVADDGSREPPDTSASSLTCTVVRQEDRGFRAAAARNLGAAATEAEILCFLDADTVPEPGYLREISRLPSMLPDALVVGRRRHADLAGWSAADLSRWWAGESAPAVLEEPRWLTDAYARTADLAVADNGAYRFVISSVMCCSRELFTYCGGFDETFDRYGGEDWEFAHRAVACGAVLHHARRAVAWHNGPDWAGRDVPDRAAAKNAEALALARLVTDPAARSHGLRYDIPDVAVELDADAHGLGSLVATVRGFLANDVGIWLTGRQAQALFERAHLQDDRIRVGPVPDRIRRSCRFLVSVTGRPALPASGVAELVRRCAAPDVAAVHVHGGTSVVACHSSWAVNRLRRWTQGPVRLADPGAVAFGAVEHCSGEEFGMTEVDREADLAW
ncbi:glycosyltransferase [Mycolicibacterium chlorophenolicum]|uniref:Chondroitin synthase n=1 Tax=Mycolicibacterium chlorophenolicum TaxID=37916 RepID=A0A0J6YWC6_9MYCO|nr:glycosyltransferase [Mycolicibacterium chlorophenolicum]KMO76766.1 Chondroitin synthase [Mycolicibacterium chlorophenolicum]